MADSDAAGIPSAADSTLLRALAALVREAALAGRPVAEIVNWLDSKYL